MAKHKRRVPLSARLTALFVLVLLHETCSAKPTPNCTSSCGDIRNINHPFRLKDDPKACGDPEYTLSCENNHVVVDIGARKYYVRQINNDNHTIRVVDSGTLQDNYSFIPRYFQTLYKIRSQYWVDSKQSKSVVFLICEKPVNSPLYYHLPACFDDGEHSSNSSFSHSKSYRYVRVGGMNASEMEDFCQVEGMFLTSWPGNVGPTNISCSDLRDVLQYGFVLLYFDYRQCHFLWYHDYCDWLVGDFFYGIGIYLVEGPPRDYLFAIGIHRALIIVVGTPIVIALLIRK